MTFKLKKMNGDLIDLAMYAQPGEGGGPGITLGERQRTYNIQHTQAVDSTNWGVAGDGLERPSLVTLRIELRRADGVTVTRAWHRTAIEQLTAHCLAAVAWQNTYDQREYALRQARVTSEVPTELSYMVELTFWESGAATNLGSNVIILPPDENTGGGTPQWGNLWT